MTYRNNHAYTRFDDSVNAGADINAASRLMNILIEQEEKKTHLYDIPAVTQTQNVFATVEMEEG